MWIYHKKPTMTPSVYDDINKVEYSSGQSLPPSVSSSPLQQFVTFFISESNKMFYFNFFNTFMSSCDNRLQGDLYFSWGINYNGEIRIHKNCQKY